MAKKKAIFCVEDEESIRGLISYVLSNHDFDVQTFAEGRSFWQKMETERPDLILLDIMLEGEDGVSILSRVRENLKYRDIPVIMLTAKTEEFDVVQGLDRGADDYITKPFGVVELVSRIKAVLRRSSPKKGIEPVVQYGNLTINKKAHVVMLGKEIVELTLKEFDLLLYLIAHEGMVLTREQLMNGVWGFQYEGESRTVDMHIMTLRNKLKKAGYFIKTVRGVGYRWEGK